MTAKRIKYGGLDAVRILNGKGDELVLVTGVGPRVMSFIPEGGTNIFYVNEEETGPGSVEDETWHLFGGTRLWSSPETGASYSPDNKPCEARIEGTKVCCISPADERTKLRKTLEVEARSRSFTVNYTISNEGTHLITAGLWALSCVKPMNGGTIYLPWGEGGVWDVKDIKYWRSWLGSQTNIRSKQWKPAEEFFVVKPTGEVGKVGFANHWGYALYRSEKISFIKQAKYIPTADYPDSGCSFEVYTCDKFYEIESLSPLYCMKPGRTYSHSEHWWAGSDQIDTSTAATVSDFVKKVLS